MTHLRQKYVSNYTGNDISSQLQFEQLTRFIEELEAELETLFEVVDSDTVDLTFASEQLSAEVRVQMSISYDPNGLMLENDVASPGADYLYGTDALGVKGWYPQPSGGGGGGLTHPQVLARGLGA